jgi:hypothetical protein
VAGVILRRILAPVDQYSHNRLILGTVILAITAIHCHGEPAKEEKTTSNRGKGTDFAAKEQNTERLQALRKRVREYEAALARGIAPPAPDPAPADTYVRKPREQTTREKIVSALKTDPMKKTHLAALKTYLTTSTNDQEKAELGTAYSLGCLVTDQWNEGARVAILMQRAYPKDKNVELLSLKSFIAECSKCTGSGEVTVKCPGCSGKKACPFSECREGKLTNPDLRIGGVAPNCPQCAGTDKCRDCKGEGTAKTKCRDCSGNGNMLRMDSIEQGYLKYLRSVN